MAGGMLKPVSGGEVVPGGDAGAGGNVGMVRAS